ncbi:MAG: class I SAM-dependent methyltransferase [Candidatus Pacearchaeota archaeon]
MTYYSFRRSKLDELLFRHQYLMKGDIIDIGGKKEKKRGSFKPPLSQVKSWKYVNIDKSTNPDFCCSAENIPVEDSSFDTVLLCEIIEHLETPEKVLTEAYRLLKRGGTLIVSVPFLFPIHADPFDYQRWTNTRIRSVIKSAGFSDIKMATMGGIGAVIHDLLLVTFNKTQNIYLKSLGFLGLRLIRPIFSIIDKIFMEAEEAITTGYFVVAKK